MKEANVDYGFQVLDIENGSRINYKRARAGFGAGCMSIILVFALLLLSYLIVSLMEQSGMRQSGMAFWAIVMIAAIVLIFWNKARKRRGPYHFDLLKDCIVAKDTRYDKVHVTKVFLNNSIDKNYSEEYIIAGGGLAGGMTAASNDLGRIYRKSMRKASFAVCILYGTKEVKIAYPLAENQAIALYNKVKEDLDQ
ncbi:phage holin family protein [Carboxylicivirga sp. N1Y90]|uniref:phage holin family protein n=1 Tax=Carboxylicivirga fragile TaxID=3417571 RepID=UPI003D3351F9|nr:phage holin family protein [Marinilabiliaceae bacterium N1Y90]